MWQGNTILRSSESEICKGWHNHFRCLATPECDPLLEDDAFSISIMNEVNNMVHRSYVHKECIVDTCKPITENEVVVRFQMGSRVHFL
jgi:ATP:corrinoid adenosyltransferase